VLQIEPTQPVLFEGRARIQWAGDFGAARWTWTAARSWARGRDAPNRPEKCMAVIKAVKEKNRAISSGLPPASASNRFTDRSE